jgi:Zn-dependent peptidase ImmA (M78 family)
VREPRPVQEGREKADAVRFEHGLGHAPVRDLFGFIERNYLEVLVAVRPMRDGPDGALLRAGKRWLIVVNSHENFLARQRFTAAHELGHYLFDRHSDPVHFAVHFILPARMIRERIREGAFNPRNPKEGVALAIEYGLSLQSLSWHLKNTVGISESERQRIADIKTPLQLARRLGLTEQARQERVARDRTSWPQQYLVLAAQAYEHGRLDEAELAEMLEDPELATEIVGNSAE